MAEDTEHCETAVQDGLIQSRDTRSEQETRKATLSWRVWKDKVYRGKICRSLCIAIASLCLGATESLKGPTFLDIQIITNTDPETASAFFTVHSLGCVMGCVLAGFLSKKFRSSFLISTDLLAMALVTTIIPFCSNLASMIIAQIVGGIFAGVVDTCLNADQMKLWGNQGQAFMQLLHFMFAAGGLVSPLISAPFLAAKENISTFTAATKGNADNDLEMYESKLNLWNWTLPDGNISNAVTTTHTSSMTSGTGNQTRETNVYFAFLIVGIAVASASIPFFIMFIKEIRQKAEEKNKDVVPQESTVPYRQIPRRLWWFLMINFCLFYFVYSGIEDTFAALLMTFLVKEYDDVSKSQGAYIVAIFWSCFASARFSMIFLTKCFSPFQLLTTSIMLMFLSYVTFTFIASLGDVIPVAIVACFIALSMSGIFASGFSWCEAEYVPVTNTVSACILIFSTLGVMVNPVLIVYAMEHNGTMWFSYVFTVEMSCLVLIFATLILFNRLYVNRKYGPLRVYNYDGQCRVENSCSVHDQCEPLELIKK